jgi:hypothetical protein
LDDLNKLSTALAELKPLDYGLANAIRIEYSMAFSAIDEISNSINIGNINTLTGGSTPKLLQRRRMPKYFFQPNKTKAVFAKTYSRIILSTSQVYADVDLSGIEDFGRERNKFLFFIKPNAVGKIIYNIMVPAFSEMLEKKCRTESMITAARLVTKLRIYEIKNGALPGNLNLLVPEYFKEVPIDIYDGKPFRYDSTNAIVYSVGRDLKDSGGSTNLVKSSNYRRRGNREDRVFSIR